MALPVWDISYKWNHVLCAFLCLLSLTEYCVFKVHPHHSLCQSFSPFHGCVIFHCVNGPHCVYLFDHLLMAIWVVSPFGVSEIGLLWTCVHKCLGLSIRVELLGHVVTPSLIFWGTARLLSKMAAPSHSHQSCWKVQTSLLIVVWLTQAQICICNQ